MSECFECDNKQDCLHEDPRIIPIEGGPCLCDDCYEAAIDERIDQAESELIQLKSERNLFLAKKQAA